VRLDQKIRLIQEMNRQAFGAAVCPRLGGNGANSLQQQERFDAFVCEFDAELPHEALVSFMHYDLGYFDLE
jgi:hypothetical protein